jgi:hypothetical protein
MNHPLDHGRFQELLDKFTAGAGIRKRFQTHSFRRGGAQYRFQYAPIGERWSLQKVRWWGGWAEGERVSLDASFPRRTSMIDGPL